MLKLLIASIFFVFISGAFHSCRPMPNNGIPFYLRMDSVSVITPNNDTQGANTQKVVDAWVQTNTTNLGTYELPIQFPVLQQGTIHFLISAGIEVSGQVGNRDVYPFYQIDTFTLYNATPGQIYYHTPIYRYKPGAQFTYINDFSTSNVGFDSMTIALDSNAVYGRCGKIAVTALGDSNKIAAQKITYPLPNGQEIWLEIDYKATIPFNIGVLYYSTTYGNSAMPVLFVKASDKWNKLYIKLSEAIGNNPSDSYALYFEALRPHGTQGGSVYVDNIKIVHF